jgi:hypothetical protein
MKKAKQMRLLPCLSRVKGQKKIVQDQRARVGVNQVFSYRDLTQSCSVELGLHQPNSFMSSSQSVRVLEVWKSANQDFCMSRSRLTRFLVLGAALSLVFDIQLLFNLLFSG